MPPVRVQRAMTSYHVHTQWSDGVGSVSEVIQSARALALDEVGISDHYVIHPSGSSLEWSMPVDRLTDYADDVRRAAKAAPSRPLVRLGLEVDFLPATIEATLAAIGACEFDYLIGSVHFINGFPVDGHRRYWDALTQDEVDETWRDYYDRLAAMAETRAFDIVGHFDLPKKFGHAPASDLRAHALRALDAIANVGMAMEVNTSGWYQPAREAYPARWIISAARERDIPITITADAHNPRYLKRDFDRAREMVGEAGYDAVVRFERRARATAALG